MYQEPPQVRMHEQAELNDNIYTSPEPPQEYQSMHVRYQVTERSIRVGRYEQGLQRLQAHVLQD